MKHKTLAIVAAATCCHAASAALVTFETFSLEPESFLNGSDAGGEFIANGVAFNNNYIAEDDTWSGFAISNITDNTTRGPANQFSARPGVGFGGSANYSISLFTTADGLTSTTVSFPANDLVGVYVTNTTWVAYDILEGGFESKKFGGASGDDKDWFKLVIQGFESFAPTEEVVEFYLADYRFEDNYVVTDWRFVDLSPLGKVDSVEFRIESSDPNKPMYFAMDNFLVVPEPSSLLMALGGLGLLLRRKR